MPATGTRDTSNLSARKYDMADTIRLLDAKQYPLLAILTGAGKDPVTGKGKAVKKMETTDPEFKWFEDSFAVRTATVAATQSIDPDASSKTFDVLTDEGALFQAGDIIQLSGAKWTFRVTSVSSDTLTVGAELGGVTGGSTSIAAQVVWIIGNANEEGSGLRAIKGTTPSEKVGYCQIFRNPFGVTNTSKATKTLIKEGDLDFQRSKFGKQHAVDIERAFIFGKKSKTTGSNGKPVRTTAGIVNTIATYATANVDTEAEFETWLESVFAHGSKEKTAFVSPAFITQINQWAQAKVQLVRSEKTYGITIMKYESAHGTLNLIKHDLLTGSVYGNYAIALDLENLMYRYLSGRDTQLLTNRQNPGDDETIEEFLSEVGLQMELESTHAIASKGAL